MTVLHPWPPASPSPYPVPVSRHSSARWRSGRLPPVALKATSWPPCEPAPLGLVGHLSVDLSAWRKVGPALVRQAQGLRAGTAELVLLNRLRARTRRGAGRETLERAARIIEVTARHWFGEGPTTPQAA